MTRKIWHLEVPESLYNQLEAYLADPTALFTHKSEFIRTAVQQLLKKIKTQQEKYV